MANKSGVPPLPEEVIVKLLEGCAETIQQSSASIYIEEDFVYSGVYAKSFGCEGVITAGHCASDFMEAERFGFIVSEERHRLWVSPKTSEHIPIGYDETEGYHSNCPDLSFVVIRDNQLLETLHGEGCVFYDLDGPKYREFLHSATPPSSFIWAVSGNPCEKVQVTKVLIDDVEHNMTFTTSAVIQGNLCEYEEGEFDYLSILLGSGFEDFPKSYKGVSGGGIWFEKFISEDGINFAAEPILLGIAIEQWKQTIKLGYRVRKIRGHGFNSIYVQLRKALVERITGKAIG